MGRSADFRHAMTRMDIQQQIARHFREVFFGGNWTASNLKDHLSGLSWSAATTRVGSLNTIVSLVYHINYYVTAILNVVKGGPLDAHDKFSFDHPVVSSQEDWEKMLDKLWNDATELAELIGQFPVARLDENFKDPKYGNYLRNFLGVIEHSHYHLGQIVLVKKLVSEQANRRQEDAGNP